MIKIDSKSQIKKENNKQRKEEEKEKKERKEKMFAFESRFEVKAIANELINFKLILNKRQTFVLVLFVQFGQAKQEEDK